MGFKKEIILIILNLKILLTQMESKSFSVGFKLHKGLFMNNRGHENMKNIGPFKKLYCECFSKMSEEISITRQLMMLSVSFFLRILFTIIT